MDIINLNIIKNQNYIEWVSDKIYSTWELECIDQGYTTINEFTKKIIKQTNNIPVTFLLLDNNVTIGTIAIELTDLPLNIKYTPWIASFYIEKMYRNKGYGEFLLLYAINYCKNVLKQKEIYLWTEQKNISFYEKRGWDVKDIVYYIDKVIYIMQYNILS